MAKSKEELIDIFLSELYSSSVARAASMTRSKLNVLVESGVPGYAGASEWLDSLSAAESANLDFLLKLSSAMTAVRFLTMCDGISGILEAGEESALLDLSFEIWQDVDDVFETKPDRTVQICSGSEITDTSLQFHGLIDDKIREGAL
jgi:hypothetical protein